MSFAFPHEQKYADVFADILPELDQFGIDSIAFMDAVTPRMEDFDEHFTPLHFPFTESAKRGTQSHYYVFNRGARPFKGAASSEFLGIPTFRIVHVNPRKQINVLDIERLLSYDELHRGVRRQAGRTYGTPIFKWEKNIQNTVERGLSFIARALNHDKKWIDDLSFITDRDPSAYKQMDFEHQRLVHYWMSALEPFIKTDAHHKYIEARLLDIAEKFTAKRVEQERDILGEIEGHLDDSVLPMFRRVPSARTTSNYNWLTHSKRMDITYARRRLAAQFPIVLLVEGFKSNPFIERMESRINIESRNAFARMVGTHDEKILEALGQLDESQIGLTNARMLPQLVPYIEQANLPGYIKRLKSPRQWDLVRQLVRVSHQTARVLGRKNDKEVFADLARQDDPYTPEDFLARHFNASGQQHTERLKDIRTLQNRLVRWVIAPKLMTEGQADGMIIPVRHAFYLAAGPLLLSAEAMKTIPRRVREAADASNDGERLITMLQKSVRIPRILDLAMDFATHQGAEEEAFRQMIYTKRLAEHAADHGFPVLPSAQLDMGYSIHPVRNQAELMVICAPTRSPLVFEAVEAVTNNIYFVSIEDMGRDVLAVGKIHAPNDDNPDWFIEKVEAMKRNGHNVNYRSLIEEYVQGLEHTRLPELNNQRAALGDRIASMATDMELIGFNPFSQQERQHRAERMGRYTGTSYQIDDLGNLSTQDWDKAVRNVIRGVRLYYPRRPDDLGFPIPGLR